MAHNAASLFVFVFVAARDAIQNALALCAHPLFLHSRRTTTNVACACTSNPPPLLTPLTSFAFLLHANLCRDWCCDWCLCCLVGWCERARVRRRGVKQSECVMLVCVHSRAATRWALARASSSSSSFRPPPILPLSLRATMLFLPINASDDASLSRSLPASQPRRRSASPRSSQNHHAAAGCLPSPQTTQKRDGKAEREKERKRTAVRQRARCLLAAAAATTTANAAGAPTHRKEKRKFSFLLLPPPAPPFC